ncbi:transposase [Chryseobacterium gambrini]|uniref:transposase n=1 Tax=Chryseobacterium gambrini TaxID=373672 RepID=UPI0022F3C788|nr:transposase [Chryseobacterium gambrini]WBX98024.1 transposase [Chryseobacterium gambrini]WBX98213.1 transposase [Chryseobacterium gambrini]WBX98702.1 transposase [Chryseobacterium gambrini]WBX98852.1 transposase [Chryseobacterium gambrini]
MLRELERKLPSTILKGYEEVFQIYLKALTQERTTKDKIYSLHEPQVACIAKGKSGKAYEFGTKVAVVRGRKTGIITSVKRFSGNPHDSRTLEESLSQSERVRKSVGGTRPTKATTDRGFKGIKEVEGTAILLPAKKEKTRYGQQVSRLRFRARAAIETCISHLKRNHSLGLNFLKGVDGDIHNALLAGIGYNLKMRLNQIKKQLILWFELVFKIFLGKYNFQNEKLAF